MAGGWPPGSAPRYDALIVDEAAQALEPATLIPMQLLKPGSRVSNWVRKGERGPQDERWCAREPLVGCGDLGRRASDSHPHAVAQTWL